MKQQIQHSGGYLIKYERLKRKQKVEFVKMQISKQTGIYIDMAGLNYGTDCLQRLARTENSLTLSTSII